MISLRPQKGHLLVAEPSIIGDVSFNRAVVLLADHSSKGSIGFILNKPLKFTLNELVSGVDKPFKVFNGGPVEQDNLYFIHKRPDLIENSIEDCDREGISGQAVTPFILEQLANATEGKSIPANLALLQNNAEVASRIARVLYS